MKTHLLSLVAGVFLGSVSLNTVASESASQRAISNDIAQRSWFNQSHSYRFNNSPALPSTVGINKLAGAFIINDDDGVYKETLAFGDAMYGGVLSPQVENLLSFMRPNKLYASGNAMLALSTTTKVALAWGSGVIVKGDENTIANVSAVYPGADSFVLVGTSAASPYVQEYVPQTGMFTKVPGLTTADPVTAVYHTGGEIGQAHAWLALTQSGKVVVWGAPDAGGQMPLYAQVALQGQVATEVYATQDAFLVRTESNQWIAWDGTPNDTTGAGEIPSNIAMLMKADSGTRIQATKSAFAAITSFGVMAWGANDCGGNIGTAISSVLGSMNAPTVHATTCSFIATDDATGKMAQWGDTERNEASETPVGRFSVLTSNNGALITDAVNGKVYWDIGTASLSSEAQNMFAIAKSEKAIASGDAYASINILGSSRMLQSWASSETALDATLTCNAPIELYSTQSPTDYDKGYFLSYHPGCGSSDITIWNVEPTIPPSGDYHFNESNQTISVNQEKGNVLYSATTAVTPEACKVFGHAAVAEVIKYGCQVKGVSVGDVLIRGYMNDKVVAYYSVYVR